MDQNREFMNRPTHYGQLTVNKGVRYFKGGNNLFNKWCWINWLSIWEEMKFDRYITSHTKLIPGRSQMQT